MDIKMVDLKSQYLKIKNEIDESILNVLESTAFINGFAVKNFQKNLEKYLGTKNVIPCGNGTDALQIAMMALDLKPGDEVITTTFTFIATAEVIALLGLTPVLVDVDEKTYNIDTEAIKCAITSKTKAIVPVHLFGQCAPMEEIMNIAREHNLYVIEDNAQAIGSDYYFSNGSTKKSGTIGQIGCTSFFPSKNLGAYGDGGAIFTDDNKLAEQIRAIVNHGMKIRYYHDFVGVNSRLDTIQAAILDIKLKHLDEYAAARQKAAEFYNNAFADNLKISTPFNFPQSSHVYHQYTMTIKDVDRLELQRFLNENGIPMMIYYPVPIHLQKAYANERYKKGDFPVSEKLAESVISLPMHTELDEKQLSYITEKVLEFIK